MKVPPRRKGNGYIENSWSGMMGLNESPSQKEGKFFFSKFPPLHLACLNESPSQKEGKYLTGPAPIPDRLRLNESPSQKEGKLERFAGG